jgi:hypothetical protein
MEEHKLLENTKKNTPDYIPKNEEELQKFIFDFNEEVDHIFLDNKVYEIAYTLQHNSLYS